MQVANDATFANASSQVVKPAGRRVNNSAAGKLQAPRELRRGHSRACSRGRRSWRMRPAALRRLALERRDAGVPASKLRCDKGLGGKTQQGIYYLGVYRPTLHRGEQALARAASRAAASKRAVAILESTSEGRA